MAVVTGVAWVVTVAAVVFVAPRFGGYYRASAAFAGRVASHVPADAPPVRVVGLGESHVSYYLTRPWTRVDDREAVARSVTGSGDHYVIARRRALRGVDPARVAELDRADALRSSETEDDRLVLVRVRPAPGAAPTRIHQ